MRAKPAGPPRLRESEERVARIGMGIVGAGFIGPHHIDAVRRLGFVDVMALADMNEALAKEKAAALHIPKSYGSYEAMLADPAIQVVHNATPNFLHYPVNAAIIAKGKHVVSDKPLALTGDEARKLRDQAVKAGVFHAVTFGYRGNPLVQQARHEWRRADRQAALRARVLHSGLAAEGHRLLVAPRGGQGRRVVGAWRHRVALVRSRAARHRHAHHARAWRPDDGHPAAQAAEGPPRGVRGRLGQRGIRSGGHQGRGSGVGAPSVRQRSQGRVHRRAGVRGPQERSGVRGLRRRRVAQVAAGAAERTVDRAPRHGQ